MESMEGEIKLISDLIRRFFIFSLFAFVSSSAFACEDYIVINKSTSDVIYRVTFFRSPHYKKNEVARVGAGKESTLCGRESGNLIIQAKEKEDTISTCSYAVSKGVIESQTLEFGVYCPMVNMAHRIIAIR